MTFILSQIQCEHKIENALINSHIILLRSGCMLKIYDHKLELQREKFFYDKITSIALTETMIIILFTNKIVQCDFYFTPIAFRVFKNPMNSIYVFNDLCIVRNSYSIHHFQLHSQAIYEKKLLSEFIRIVPFYTSSILNYKDYKISIVNIDFKTTIVEEYELADTPIEIQCTDLFIIIVYRHGIEVIYKTNRFLLSFDSDFYTDISYDVKIQDNFNNIHDQLFNIENKILGDASCENKHLEYYKGKFKHIGISFYNVQIIKENTMILIINGDGKVYNLKINVEVNRILDIEMEYKENLTTPSCSDYFQNETSFGYIVGSLNNKTIANINDKKIYLDNLEKITGISIKNNKIGLFTESHYVVYEQFLRFNLSKYKLFTGDELIVFNNQLYGKVNQNYFEINLKTLTINSTSVQISVNQNLLEEVNKDYKIKINDKNIIEIYKNNIIIFTTKIFDMNNFIYTNNVSNNTMLKLHITEISSLLHNNMLYLFIVTNKLLYVYKVIQINIIFLEKQFVNEIIYCNNNDSRILYNCCNFIFIKSQQPYFAFVKDKLYLIKSKHLYKSMVLLNNNIYVLTKTIIGETKNTLITQIDTSKGLMITKYKPLVINNTNHKINYKHTNLIPNNNNHSNDKIFKYTTTISTYKKIVCAITGTNFTLTGSFVSDFYMYVPFVPLVHRTTDDNKTITERMEPFKLNKKTSILGETKLCSLQLFNQHFDLIDEVEFEINEYITDVKLVLNDYVVISLSTVDSEDKCTKSRIILYSIVPIVIDNTCPKKNLKLKYLGEEKIKYAIHSFDVFYKKKLQNHNYVLSDILLIVGVGTRLMIYELNYNEFTPIGRLEISVGVIAVTVVRNLILLGDLFTGMELFYLRPENPTKLTFLGSSKSIPNLRNVFPLTLVNVNNGCVSQIYFIGVVKTGRLEGFVYDPENIYSLKGTILLKTFDITIYEQGFPIVTYNKHENYIIINNVIFSIYKYKSINMINAIYTEICNIIDNTCGLNPLEFLETNELMDNTVEKVYFKRIFLEYTNMSMLNQLQIQKIINLTHVEILDILFIGIK